MPLHFPNMKSSSTKLPRNNQQETYIRSRDDPFFSDTRRGEAEAKRSSPDFRRKIASRRVFRSSSDVYDLQPGDVGRGSVEDLDYNSYADSPSDIVLEPVGRSSSGRWSKTSSPLAAIHFDFVDVFDHGKELIKVSSPKFYEAKEERLALTVPRMISVERSFSLKRSQEIPPKVTLPPSAALFYNGQFPKIQVVETSESVCRLNTYLKTNRDDVNAGVPGRFLHAVVGPDTADVGSIVSTIMYAFYLRETQKSDEFFTVPIINMKREDMHSRGEIKWLFESCQIDQSSLIFIDEIDLSYYDLFGSLKLVLLNCDKLPPKLEVLHDSVVEIFHCVKDVSSCTAIAEKLLHASPKTLVGRGISRLLLTGILLDTGNLTNPQSTDKDKWISTLLINGAGRYSFSGLYHIMKYKRYDVTDLKLGDILQKDFKNWAKLGQLIGSHSRLITSYIGMSSIGMPVGHLLSHEATSAQEISQFRRHEKLSVLLIVSGYYDTQQEFQREILVCAESNLALKDILQFLNSHEPQLPLRVLHRPGLQGDMRVFKIDRVVSRSTIEQLLDDYCAISG